MVHYPHQLMRTILSVALLLLPCSLAAQARLTESDVRGIIAASIRYTRAQFNPAYTFEHRNRPIFVDADSAAKAFRGSSPGLSKIPEQGLGGVLRSRAAILDCSGHECQVKEDGVLFNVINITPTERGYSLRVDPEFNRNGRVARGNTLIYEVEKVDGEWTVSTALYLVP